MKPSMLNKLANLSERLDEIDRLMASEGITDNMENYLKLTKEHAEITPIVAQYRAYVQTEADMAEAQKMLSDPEMKEFAQEEIETAKNAMMRLILSYKNYYFQKTPMTKKILF
jgi:peptide chain release factor 1